MDINGIMKILPHRYPFLLVDRILEIVPEQRAVGIKNVTINENFFQGHFPGHPVMPGVLIIEFMAQIAGILAYQPQAASDEDEMEGRVIYFMSIDKVKFRKPVVPGDQLRGEVVVLQRRRKIGSFLGKAYVGNDLVCEAEMKAILVDREEGRDASD
ncbi:MAG: 3-hydroxyacyl-ACP dehydratase FabZ [bacterium]|nr:MAG: 3-hydroxyacyl-ACP dehydratase FabZ [bacterium]